MALTPSRELFIFLNMKLGLGKELSPLASFPAIQSSRVGHFVWDTLCSLGTGAGGDGGKAGSLPEHSGGQKNWLLTLPHTYQIPTRCQTAH